MWSQGISQLFVACLLSSPLVQAAPGRVSITPGTIITFKATSKGSRKLYLAHTGDSVDVQQISSASTTAAQQTALWNVVQPLNATAEGCVSFESFDTPGSYIRHSFFELYINQADGGDQFTADATFCPQPGLTTRRTTSIQSSNFPDRYFRHYQGEGYLANNNGPLEFDNPISFEADASWIIGTGFGTKVRRSLDDVESMGVEE